MTSMDFASLICFITCTRPYRGSTNTDSAKLQYIDRLFQPARTNSIDAKSYHRVIDARVSKKSNSARALSEGTHFARAQQRLQYSRNGLLFTGNCQLCVSGDDMKIIQVGCPAVSRYHQQRRFFLNGEGPDHKTHDFPTSHLGIKLGGFMMLRTTTCPVSMACVIILNVMGVVSVASKRTLFGKSCCKINW
jgi:hypothetical protein